MKLMAESAENTTFSEEIMQQNERFFMLDFARERSLVRSEFSIILDKLRDFHYNGLGLYLETSYDFSFLPGIPSDSALTREDVRWIVEQAEARGLSVFPMTNVASHMELYLKAERTRDITGAYLPAYKQLDFSKPEAHDLAMKIVRELAEVFGTTFVHIGGDEAHLPTDELRAAYGDYVSGICRDLIAEGIRPAIWGDMLWVHQEIADKFPRETYIFDWNYFGHRDGSLRFFKEKGFKHIFPCPCDNSWNFYVNYQHLFDADGARMDIPVRPDEVEAMFDDARALGIRGGMMTHWENHRGAIFFSNLAAFARAGLYLDNAPCDDEALEMAMFGHITPYLSIIRQIQDNIISFGDNCLEHRLHASLFVRKNRDDLLQNAPYLYRKYGSNARTHLPEIEKAVAEYVPQNAYESLVFRSLKATVSMIRASLETCCAYAQNARYAEAAAKQFSSPEEGLAILREIREAFETAKDSVVTLKRRFAEAIENTGHTKRDLEHLQWTVEFIDGCLSRLDQARDRFDRIPILRWEYIIATENIEAYFL